MSKPKQTNCLNCEERFVGCHSDCPLGLYKPQDYTERRRIAREAMELNHYMIDKMRRLNKGRRF